MTEETKDAARNMPVATAEGCFGNGIMAVILLIAYLFATIATPSVKTASMLIQFLHYFLSLGQYRQLESMH
ncbi:hypothetical protein N7504_000716 [Penicillium tannophilum]|nr:hypothetical protein N7504_000716 [Penicillium tannophilum]